MTEFLENETSPARLGLTGRQLLPPRIPVSLDVYILRPKSLLDSSACRTGIPSSCDNFVSEIFLSHYDQVKEPGNDLCTAIPQIRKANTYSVRATLQQDINGSVDIPIAIMQCDHRLILVLACDVNQLQKLQKQVAHFGWVRRWDVIPNEV